MGEVIIPLALAIITGSELMSATGVSLMFQTVKNRPAMWETQVRSLGWEDPWRRAQQPTPVFLPGELRGQRSLVCYSPSGCRESDTTEHTHNPIKHKLYSSSKIHVHGRLQNCWDEDLLRYRKCDARAAEFICPC